MAVLRYVPEKFNESEIGGWGNVFWDWRVCRDSRYGFLARLAVDRMILHEFRALVRVDTPLGEGYALFIETDVHEHCGP